MLSKEVKHRIATNRWVRRMHKPWEREREEQLRTTVPCLVNPFLPPEYRYPETWLRSKAVLAMSREECKAWVRADRQADAERRRQPEVHQVPASPPDRAAINAWMAGTASSIPTQPYQPSDTD